MILALSPIEIDNTVTDARSPTRIVELRAFFIYWAKKSNAIGNAVFQYSH